MHRDITVDDLLKIDNKAKLLDYIDGICCESGLFSEEELKMMRDPQTLVISGKQKYTQYNIFFQAFYDPEFGYVDSHKIETDCWKCAMFQLNEYIYRYAIKTFGNLTDQFLNDFHDTCPCCKISNSGTKFYSCLLCFDCLCETCFSNMTNHEHNTYTENMEKENYLSQVWQPRCFRGNTLVGVYYDINRLLSERRTGASSIKCAPYIYFTQQKSEDYKILQKDCHHHKQFVNKTFESDISDEEKGHWWGVYAPRKRLKTNTNEEK